MLVVLRFIFTGLFIWLLLHLESDSPNLEGDVSNAGWLAAAVITGIATAVVWAPWIGTRIATPLTDVMVDGTVIVDDRLLLRWIHRCERRGWRSLGVILCFIEGVREPDLPGAFVFGMNMAKPGSWLESAFARRVYDFNNVFHCVRALEILRFWHGIDPGQHPQVEVRLAVLSTEISVRPAQPMLAVPSAPLPQTLKRNTAIRLPGSPGKKSFNNGV